MTPSYIEKEASKRERLAEAYYKSKNPRVFDNYPHSLYATHGKDGFLAGYDSRSEEVEALKQSRIDLIDQFAAMTHKCQGFAELRRWCHMKMREALELKEK